MGVTRYFLHWNSAQFHSDLIAYVCVWDLCSLKKQLSHFNTICSLCLVGTFLQVILKD